MFLTSCCRNYQSSDLPCKPQTITVSSNVLSRNDLRLINDLMIWFAATKFESEHRKWFINESEAIQHWTGIMLTSSASISPYKLRYLPDWDDLEFTELHLRLVLTACKFAEIAFAKSRPTRQQLIALCIVIAELLEDISVKFHSQSKAASEILTITIYFAQTYSSELLSILTSTL